MELTDEQIIYLKSISERGAIFKCDVKVKELYIYQLLKNGSILDYDLIGLIFYGFPHGKSYMSARALIKRVKEDHPEIKTIFIGNQKKIFIHEDILKKSFNEQISRHTSIQTRLVKLQKIKDMVKASENRIKQLQKERINIEKFLKSEGGGK